MHYNVCSSVICVFLTSACNLKREEIYLSIFLVAKKNLGPAYTQDIFRGWINKFCERENCGRLGCKNLEFKPWNVRHSSEIQLPSLYQKNCSHSSWTHRAYSSMEWHWSVKASSLSDDQFNIWLKRSTEFILAFMESTEGTGEILKISLCLAWIMSNGTSYFLETLLFSFKRGQSLLYESQEWFSYFHAFEW